MKQLIGEHITSSAHLAKRHVHPRLMKMFEVGGMGTVFMRAEGPYLFDAAGNRWLDMLAGGGVMFIGRNHPVVKKAIADTVDLDIPNLCVVNASVLGGLVAQRLLELTGNTFGKVVFANSGTEATDVAIRFARYATRRRRFLYLDGSFHGRSYAAVSLCGWNAMQDGSEPLMPQTTPVRPNDIDQLRRELSRGDVAGFIFEPVQGMTCNVMTPQYLAAARELCTRYGTYLIADEVQTGLGRVGHWFATPGQGIQADLLTVSKTLSGGYVPVAAVLIRDEVYDRVYDKFKAGAFYFSTFAENNMAMAASIATLDVLAELDAPKRAMELSNQLRTGLNDIATRYDCIDRVAGAGLMCCIYFRDSDDFKLKVQQKVMGQIDPGTFGAAVNVAMYTEQRVIVQIPGPEMNAVKVLPPVTLSDDDMAYFLGSFEKALASFYVRGPLVSLGRAAVKDTIRDVKEKITGKPAVPQLTEGALEPARKAPEEESPDNGAPGKKTGAGRKSGAGRQSSPRKSR